MELSLDDPRSITYVDLGALVVVLNSGDLVPITNLFDADGDECDPDDAVVIVAGSHDFGWLVMPLEWADDDYSVN